MAQIIGRRVDLKNRTTCRLGPALLRHAGGAALDDDQVRPGRELTQTFRGCVLGGVGPRPGLLDAWKLDDDQALGRPLALQRFGAATANEETPAILGDRWRAARSRRSSRQASPGECPGRCHAATSNRWPSIWPRLQCWVSTRSGFIGNCVSERFRWPSNGARSMRHLQPSFSKFSSARAADAPWRRLQAARPLAGGASPDCRN